MDPKFQTSFIPKKVMSEPTYRTGISLFLLLSIIIFLITLGISGWVYLEKQALMKNIEETKQTINDNKNSFDPDTIQDIVSLNSRIITAESLLKKHITVAPIFSFLQDHTLKNVRFKSFSFTNDGKNIEGENSVSISLGGQAATWETLASQADEFGKQEYRKIIHEPKVSSFSLNPDGGVSFSFSAFVQPEFISYESLVNSQNQ